MTRKDTILVAVLINAGLLIVLFATASKTADAPVLSRIGSGHEEGSGYSTVEVPVYTEHASDATQMLPQMSATMESELRFEPKELEIAQVLPPSLNQSLDESAGISGTAVNIGDNVSAEKNQANEIPFVKHVVVKGDVLDKIAKMYKTQVDAIMAANGLTTTNLKIGQVIKIPAAKNEKKAVPVMNTDAEQKFYIVKPGDSPWTIAVKNKMKLEDLLRLNHLDQEKAKKLKPGDKLRTQ